MTSAVVIKKEAHNSDNVQLGAEMKVEKDIKMEVEKDIKMEDERKYFAFPLLRTRLIPQI